MGDTSETTTIIDPDVTSTEEVPLVLLVFLIVMVILTVTLGCFFYFTQKNDKVKYNQKSFSNLISGVIRGRSMISSRRSSVRSLSKEETGESSPVSDMIPKKKRQDPRSEREGRSVLDESKKIKEPQSTEGTKTSD